MLKNLKIQAKIFFILFFLLMLIGSFKAVFGANGNYYYYYGDIDKDERITSADARIILRAAVGLETLNSTEKILADINQDGKINKDDATKALRVAVNLEKPIASTIEITSKSNGTKVFIGDSRTVLMYGYLFGWNAEAVNRGTVDKNNDVWSAKSAMGLDWMKKTGVSNIENKITNGSKIIIMMGINDLYNKNNYVTYINQKANEWTKKGAKVYFVSVNPVDEVKERQNGYSVKNSTIEDFNKTLKNGLNSNVTYIDTYSQIKSNFSTSDGVHYTETTSNLIYKLICNYV